MMIFIIFTAIIAVSCSAITIKTLVGYSGFSLFTKILVTIFVTFSWFAPIVSMTLKRTFPGVPSVIIVSQILYMLFGLAFILIVVLLVRDFIWYILYYSKKFNVPNIKDAAWLNKLNIIAVIFSLLVFSYALYEGLKDPDIKEVELVSSKIKDKFDIVLITDIHIDQETSDAKIKRLVEKVNSLNPDAVLFVGDMVDGSVKVLGSKIDILKSLKPKKGTFFTSGNHELYNGFGEWILKFSSLGDGFYFIDNISIDIAEQNVFILGIPDTRVLRLYPQFLPDLEKVMGKVDSNKYRILMSHAPDVANSLPIGAFDLQVSGHTHGGQIFPFHFLAKIENKFLAGLYDVNGTKLYVSRGAGYWGPPLRFLAPSEITLIKLRNN